MITYNKHTPILFTIFNRPDTTLLVFKQIRKAQPKKLYIAADGARTEKEAELCNETRKIVDLIDWDCSVEKLFQKDNLGCRKGMIKAITWFFDNEPEGIILEDDCLPSNSFFGFCSTLLEKYRDDERIGLIMGSNFQKGKVRGDGSYYFSSLTNVWGWAGWRRVWKDYDPDMKTLPLFQELEYMDNAPSYKPFKSIWASNLKDNYTDSNGWDYQYMYYNMINSRLSIIPNKNLISNIGCDNNASHFTQNHPFTNIESGELGKIIHPTFVLSDISADIFSQKREYQLVTDDGDSLEGYQFLQKKLSELSTLTVNQQKIPKIIHQFYEDPSGPPKILASLSNTWKELHPDWEYCFWNKEAIEKFMIEHFSELIPVYNNFTHPVQRWNAMRYLILYHIGGLYVDLDCECIESIEPLLINSVCCLGLEPVATADRYNEPFIIGNAFMASIPKHLFFKTVFDNVFSITEKKEGENEDVEIFESIGPFMLTRLYDAYANKQDIILIPGDLLTPLTLTEVCLLMKGQETQVIENKVEKAYAVRYFFNSLWRL